jgi:DNA helicase-2/ATP-dependent DNA helicase PcrA
VSTEQDRLLDHPIGANGRVLAGPGTGKSTTVLRLVARLSEDNPNQRVKVITFTRAAIAELVEKIREEGYGLIEPTTLHSFALSVLMRNPGMTNLPEPLRVPDKWETKTLLNPDLSIRLKAVGHSDATPTLVAKLTNEMAAGWDRLDPGHVLLSDVDPSLRNAYRAAWMAQRTVFGYSLFAEMPFTARELIQDHPNLDMGDVAFLVVDEYQDLNRCDIGLVEAVAEPQRSGSR